MGLSRLRLMHGHRDVLGKIDQHRTGPATLRKVKSLVHRGGNLTHIPDDVAVFHHGQGDPENIDLLEGVGPLQRVGHLAGDDHHRNGIQVRIGDARHQVSGSGPAGGHAHARLAGYPAVRVGRECRALLVPAQVVLEAGINQRVVQRHDGAARIAENMFNTIAQQRFDHQLRSAAQFDGGFLGQAHGDTPQAACCAFDLLCNQLMRSRKRLPTCSIL